MTASVVFLGARALTLGLVYPNALQVRMLDVCRLLSCHSGLSCSVRTYLGDVVAAPLRLAGHLGVVSPACSEDMPVEYPWFVD